MHKKVKIGKRKAIAQEDGLYKILFPFSYDLLAKIKTLQGRKFYTNGKIRYWTCPITVKNSLVLKNLGFDLVDIDKDHYEEIFPKNDYSDIPPIEVKGLKKKLRPFQKVGVSFINSNNGRGLIADEMGLGKTIQSLAYIRHTKLYEKGIVLIICPSIAKWVWFNEIKKWYKKKPKIQILEGRKPQNIIDAKIVIINYAILHNWIKVLKHLPIQSIITDECHYYKSDSAKRTSAIKYLARGIPSFIAISGTPIEKTPVDIFNAVNIINPMLFPNKWCFLHRYCDPKHNGFGWSFNGSSHEYELHTKLKNVMIRRKKEDVAKELPPKIWSNVPLQSNNKKDYDEALYNFINFIKKKEGKKASKRASKASALVQLETLKQVAVQGKLMSAIEWIENFLESGEKLIVFTIHTFVLDILMEKFKDIAVRVDGNVSNKNREKNVSLFQTKSNIKLFFGQMKAAGVVITLTAASNIAILELPNTPGPLLQAVDRSHRIGQRKTVNINVLLAKGTIEERMSKILINRMKIANKVIDGVVFQDEDESMIDALINYITDEKN